jgi:hypothetical protein
MSISLGSGEILVAAPLVSHLFAASGRLTSGQFVSIGRKIGIR